MNILLKTSPSNRNALVIKTALMMRGHSVQLDFQASFPASQRKSIFIESGITTKFQSQGSDFNKTTSQCFDVVVWLNSERIKLAEYLDEDDRAYANFESDIFLRSSNYFLGQDVFWINPNGAYAKANLKPVQLDIANNLELRVPSTLISNDFEEILKFFGRDEFPILVKPFASPTWTDKEESFYFFPATIIEKRTLIENRDEVGSCPMIYQKCIDKDYEVRVTVMGETVLAAKITVENRESIDWRVTANKTDYSIEKIELPTDIHNKSILMVKELGLVYGCIDYMVDMSGDYYFLEVNNAGHFLWKERHNNGLPMLHIFCEFIESKDPNFRWDGREQYLYKSILNSASYN